MHRAAPRLLLTGLVTVLVACGGGGPSPAGDSTAKDSAATKPVPPSLPPLNTLQADRAVEALGAVVPEQASRLAALALAELEVGRLPPFLIDALTASANAAPDVRAQAIARALDSVPGRVAWIQACRGGLQVFEDLAVAAPTERGPLLWRECALADLGLADEATILAADPTMVMLALVGFDHLRRSGEVAAQEKTLLQMMLRPPEEG